VGHAWTPTQDEALRDAAEAGIGMEDVVDQLELPVDAIQARLAQLGLTLADSNDVDDLSTKLVEGSDAGPGRSGTRAQDDAEVEEPSLFPDPGRPATQAKRL
jgi:hypothetical protein